MTDSVATHVEGRRAPRSQQVGTTENERAFRRYYQQQLELSEGEFEDFHAKLLEPLPVTFRLVGALRQGSTAAVSNRFHCQLIALRQTGSPERQVEADVSITKTKCESVTACKSGHGIRRLDWYPHSAAWQLEVPKRELRDPGNKAVQQFLIREVSVGAIVRMEAVSMLPALILAAKPGELVLDMCAAPGSKTGQLLEMVLPDRSGVGGGAVIANDPDVKRSSMMIHRTKSLCSPSLVVTARPGQCFPLLWSGGRPLPFDRVLCDVPCSGDGTIRKSAFILKKWQHSHALQNHILQVELLKRSLQLLRVGGRCVYSTCSLNPVENEAVVAEVLRQAAEEQRRGAGAGGGAGGGGGGGGGGAGLEGGSAVRVEAATGVTGLLRVREGMLRWKVPSMNEPDVLYESFESVPEGRTNKSRSKSDYSKRGLLRSMFPPAEEVGAALGLRECVRVLPHDQDTGGFFICLLHKTAPLPWDLCNQAPGTDDGDQTQQGPGADSREEKEEEEEEDSTKAKAESAAAEEQNGQAGAPREGEEEGREGGEEDGSRGALPPSDYIDRCTRLQRMEVRVGKVTPYSPLTSSEAGRAAWAAIRDFYGVSEAFPHQQLLAHSQRAKTITFVTAPARAALEAAGGEGGASVGVVTAGTRMFEENECAYAKCRYRLCTDGLRFLRPFMSKRCVELDRETMATLLRDGELEHDIIPPEMAGLEAGSVAVWCEEEMGVVWRGRTQLKLWVTKEEAASMLARLLAGEPA